MTKKQLLATLTPFDDDQWAFINLHGTDKLTENGCQIFIQGVRAIDPWHVTEKSKNLIDIDWSKDVPRSRAGIDPEKPIVLVDGSEYIRETEHKLSLDHSFLWVWDRFIQDACRGQRLADEINADAT